MNTLYDVCEKNLNILSTNKIFNQCEETVMQKYDIPYGISKTNIFDLLKEIKSKPSINESELSSLIGNQYPRAKSSAKELKLIILENEKIYLTQIGKDVAWETDKQKKGEIIINNLILAYYPYQIAFKRMLKDQSDEVDTEFIQQIWARELGINITTDNLARAVSFFFSLLEESNVGTCIIGRRGKKTRFQKISNIKETFDRYTIPEKRENDENGELIPDINTLKEDKNSLKTTEFEPLKSDLGINKNIIDNKFKKLVTDRFELYYIDDIKTWELLSEFIPIFLRQYQNKDVEE